MWELDDKAGQNDSLFVQLIPASKEEDSEELSHLDSLKSKSVAVLSYAGKAKVPTGEEYRSLTTDQSDIELPVFHFKRQNAINPELNIDDIYYVSQISASTIYLDNFRANMTDAEAPPSGIALHLSTRVLTLYVGMSGSEEVKKYEGKFSETSSLYKTWTKIYSNISY